MRYRRLGYPCQAAASARTPPQQRFSGSASSCSTRGALPGSSRRRTWGSRSSCPCTLEGLPGEDLRTDSSYWARRPQSLRRSPGPAVTRRSLRARRTYTSPVPRCRTERSSQDPPPHHPPTRTPIRPLFSRGPPPFDPAPHPPLCRPSLISFGVVVCFVFALPCAQDGPSRRRRRRSPHPPRRSRRSCPRAAFLCPPPSVGLLHQLVAAYGNSPEKQLLNTRERTSKSLSVPLVVKLGAWPACEHTATGAPPPTPWTS